MFHDVHSYAIMHMFDIRIVLIIFCNNFPKTKGKYRISTKGLSAIKFTKRPHLLSTLANNYELNPKNVES